MTGRITRVVLLFASVALLCCAQEPTSFLPSAMRLIVMVNGELDGSETFGGGIIFGRTANEVYIVTANHVVRKGPVEARNIRLRLRDSSNAVIGIEAVLLPNADKEADVAVLKAVTQRHNFDSCALMMNALASIDRLQRGAAVYPVGAPNGIPWAMPVTPDRVAEVVDGQVVFQSSFITIGHSGGALLEENGELLAMISADAPPFGRSISMGKMLPRLRGWGYPVELRPRNSASPLFAAVQNGDPAQVRSALAAPCNELDGAVDGDTPLHEAVNRGSVQIVKLILAAGARINTKAMYLAARGGSPDVVQALLDAGGRPQAEGDQDYSPLDVAVKRGHVDVARLLIRAGAKASSVKINLLDAASSGTIETLGLLLELGADVNQRNRERNRDGYTPLQMAVRHGRPAIVTALLNAGADVNLATQSGEAPLHVAITAAWQSTGPEEKKRGLEVVGVLITKGARLDQLVLAAKGGSIVSGNGLTPLTLAATYGQVEIVKLLLDAGADVNAVDSVGRTALHYAADMSAGKGVRDIRATQLDLIQLLLQRGANLNAMDKNGEPPLCRALRGDPANPRIKIAEILLTAGAKTLSDWDNQCRGDGRDWAPDADINRLLRSYASR